MIRLLLLVTLLAACGGAPARVNLAETWPAQASSWDDARARWTRRAAHSDDWTRVIHAAATLQSSEWRAAYTRERARRLRLPPAEEAALLEAQKQAAAEVWEVELIVATSKPDWNDFRKGKLSMWRVALAGDGDREVLPISITEDRRPRPEIAAYFPDLQPFYQAYIVKFPKVTPDGQPIAGKRLALKISGPLGAIEMVWEQ